MAEEMAGKARQADEEAYRKEQEADEERRKIAAAAEAARLAEERAKLDAEAGHRKRREEATAWFYQLNYMQIKKWLTKNEVHTDSRILTPIHAISTPF